MSGATEIPDPVDAATLVARLRGPAGGPTSAIRLEAMQRIIELEEFVRTFARFRYGSSDYCIACEAIAGVDDHFSGCEFLEIMGGVS